MSTSAKSLMNCRFPQPDATHRLFCFPWAGGGSNFYAAWGKLLPPNIEVYGITLAGRESRFREVPSSSLQETVGGIASTIITELGNKPFIFFGHSMGALLSYETAVLLKKEYGRQPEHMYLSGVSAPHVKKDKASISKRERAGPHPTGEERSRCTSVSSPSPTCNLIQSEIRRKKAVDLSSNTDEEFLEHLKKLGGTPPEILNDQELLKLYLPSLKADYMMVNQAVYERPEGTPVLSCNFTFFDGAEDDEHDYEGWKELTQGSFSLHKMPGNHFYIKEKHNSDRILEYIRQDFPVAFGCLFERSSLGDTRNYWIIIKRKYSVLPPPPPPPLPFPSFLPPHPPPHPTHTHTHSPAPNISL